MNEKVKRKVEKRIDEYLKENGLENKEMFTDYTVEEFENILNFYEKTVDEEEKKDFEKYLNESVKKEFKEERIFIDDIIDNCTDKDTIEKLSKYRLQQAFIHALKILKVKEKAYKKGYETAQNWNTKLTNKVTGYDFTCFIAEDLYKKIRTKYGTSLDIEQYLLYLIRKDLNISHRGK